MGLRTCLLRAHEALLGRNTFAVLQQLESRPIESLPAMRLDALRRLLRHAVQEIPYWRNRLAGIDVESVTLESLAPIPILTRADIVQHREEMRWIGPGKELLLHRSGGTTDDNLVFYWGRERQAWDRATRIAALRRLGIEPGDRVLHLWPREPSRGLKNSAMALAREARDWVLADPIVDGRPWTAADRDRVLQRIRRFRPRLIVAYPSWLMRLAYHLETTGPKRTALVEKVLACGEVLFDFQRRYLERVLGATVYQEFGSHDVGMIAHEDSAKILRFNMEQMVVEILRDGRPVPVGELGELVITNFFTPRMPFIRYATGDVVRRLPEGRPVCERGLPEFPVPEGRTSDLLLSSEGRLVATRPMVESLVQASGVLFFSLNQRQIDRVEVVCSQEFGEISLSAAQQVLRTHLGEAMTIELHVGPRFEALRSGKHRFVCSPVAMAAIAHDRESSPTLNRSWEQTVERV